MFKDNVRANVRKFIFDHKDEMSLDDEQNYIIKNEDNEVLLKVTPTSIIYNGEELEIDAGKDNWMSNLYNWWCPRYMNNEFEGTGMPGRPAGVSNSSVTIINWHQLCVNCRVMGEFYVPIDDEYIDYIISKDEFIRITKIVKDENTNYYQISYNNKLASLWIKCQLIKTGNELDKFINRLLADSYDWKIEGVIKPFLVDKQGLIID